MRTVILLALFPLAAVSQDKPPASGAYSTDQSIRFFEDRVRGDPSDYSGHTTLAHLFIRKARETGDYAWYDRADGSVGLALKQYPDYVPARATLALIRCAQHRFVEGLELAEKLYRADPEGEYAPGLLQVVGDAQLELGRYAAAEATYRKLQEAVRGAPVPSVLARHARLAELKGQTAEALRHLGRALEVSRADLESGPGLAWYLARLGEISFNAGRINDAAGHHEAALKEYPTYHVALSGLGRVRAAQGKADEATELVRKAAARSADLATLVLLGDLYAQSGNEFLAKLNYAKVEAAGKTQDAFARELAMYYCDHDKNLPAALELAQKDLKARQDLYAYDTLAWALYKNGKLDEAAAAMQSALQLGTQDAALYYHAGMIHLGRGDKARAREFLARALKLNPHFSPRHAEEAKRILGVP